MRQKFKITYLYLFVTIAVMPLFYGCKADKLSNKRKMESTAIHLRDSVEIFSMGRLMEQKAGNGEMLAENKGRGLLTQFADKAITVGIVGVSKLIDMSKANFTAKYTGAKTSNQFYSKVSRRGAFDPDGMAFDGFSFHRTCKTGKNKTETVMSAWFSVDKSNLNQIANSGCFSLILDSIEVNYSKAKIAKPTWYLPWTLPVKNHKQVNLDIEIIVTASWISSDAHIYCNEEIGRFMLNLRNVPLDKNAPGYKEYFNKLKGKPVKGSSYIVPRSAGFNYDDSGYKECFGKGQYNINVNIAESGRNKFVNKVTQVNSEKVASFIMGKVIKQQQPEQQPAQQQ
ncbi:MAG: hypothetical protein KKA07_13435 [Bacteroidetes bacterium]|nr:hypothetical protein [Bacteroidota bacterium]MBU1720062.1 hypothetical protein [Bacteroidota bacterium]